MLSQSSFQNVSWEQAFEEGEKRIKKNLLDALIKTPSRDRARLFTQREMVKIKIEQALKQKNGRKLKHAFQEQTKLLRRMAHHQR